MTKKQAAIVTAVMSLSLIGLGMYLIDCKDYIAVGVFFMIWGNNIKGGGK